MTGEEAILPATLAYLRPRIVNDLGRYGGERDGGYILPPAGLATIDAVVSFGLSTDWSLEEALAKSHPGLIVHVYDHTVGARSFRRSLKNAATKFLAGKTSLAELRQRFATDRGYRKFFRGERAHFRERIFNRRDNANDTMIETVFARVGTAQHIFLKMDIEGGEYRVIPAILRYESRIDLMVIEFHDTDPLRPVFEAQVKEILEHFDIVHLHGNNIAGAASDHLPDCLEITFLSKRFATPARFRDRLPLLGLDYPNDPARPDLPLYFA